MLLSGSPCGTMPNAGITLSHPLLRRGFRFSIDRHGLNKRVGEEWGATEPGCDRLPRWRRQTVCNTQSGCIFSPGKTGDKKIQKPCYQKIKTTHQPPFNAPSILNEYRRSVERAFLDHRNCNATCIKKIFYKKKCFRSLQFHVQDNIISTQDGSLYLESITVYI